jgi:hypothetical protein
MDVQKAVCVVLGHKPERYEPEQYGIARLISYKCKRCTKELCLTEDQLAFLKYTRYDQPLWPGIQGEGSRSPSALAAQSDDIINDTKGKVSR